MNKYNEAPHAPSLASLRLAANIYASVENHITENSETSKGEVIRALAEVLQEVRNVSRTMVVQGNFTHMN